MKLCRYGKNGFEKPGMVDGEGRLRDLSKVVENIGPKELAPRGLKMLAKIKPETLAVVANGPRMGVPFVGIGKFVAIGLNYSDHAKEAGLPIPAEPIVFMKATTSISGPNDDIIQPRRPMGWRAMKSFFACTGSANALMRSPSEGVSTVPGPMQLQRMPCFT